jgi:hypothetical protein
MGKLEGTIYDLHARAPLYRRATEWVITVSGYAEGIGDFVYRILRAPLNTPPAQIGAFAIQAMKGYRRLIDAPSDRGRGCDRRRATEGLPAAG